MKVVPITLKEACRFMRSFHRHNVPVAGWRFGCALVDDGNMVDGPHSYIVEGNKMPDNCCYLVNPLLSIGDGE